MTAREQAREALAAADVVTAEQLRDADAAVAAARVALEQAQAVRASAIGRAMDDDGWTLARVAEALGISFQRVSQIRRGQ